MVQKLASKLLLAAALTGMLPVSAAVRRVWVRPYPVHPWGYTYWYDPFVYDPYFYYGPRAVYDRNVGEVKLDTNTKDAQVFVDGGYAGIARKLKTMWLRAGTHDLEVRATGGAQFQQRIYVQGGKTLHVHAEL